MSLPILGCCGGLKQQDPPVIRGTVQVSQQSTGTTFAPTLPAHQSGDKLVVIVGHKGATHLSAAGWTELEDIDAGGYGLSVYALTATGSAHTISISNGNDDRIIAHAYAISATNGDIASQSAITTRDPPALSPPWGAEAAFWIVANATASTPPASGPAGFSDSVQTANATLTLSTLDKAELTATQNPAAFSGTDAPSDNTATIGVRPRP